MAETAVSPRVLIVDDNPMVANLLEQVLRSEGNDVAVAGDGLEALAEVERSAPDLILLDLDLPGLHGYEVCRRLKANPATRLIPIVIVTARCDSGDRVDAWDLGADDFLTKPFRLAEVTARCRSLLRIKRLIDERDSAEAVVFALARAVEAKSPYTHGHAGRVRGFALELAAAVGASAEDRELLGKGALLHDIGKISVRDAILEKPGRLTTEEYDLVKDHTRQGTHIVEPLHSLRDAVPLIRWHHERLDGGGYPDGLRGDQVPHLVRILAVADVFDSLASDRPYRARMPLELCLEILSSNARGGGLDPQLVDCFSGIVRDLAPLPPMRSTLDALIDGPPPPLLPNSLIRSAEPLTISAR
jgi:putative two-component system response regulator